MSHRNVLVRDSKEVWAIVTENIYERMDEPIAEILKEHLESIKEEKYEEAHHHCDGDHCDCGHKH